MPPLTVASYDFAESRESVITTDFTPILSETVPLSVNPSFVAFSGYDEILTVGGVTSTIIFSIVCVIAFPYLSLAAIGMDVVPSDFRLATTFPL